MFYLRLVFVKHARPCNVFVVLRRVRNSRTIIIIYLTQTLQVSVDLAELLEARRYRPMCRILTFYQSLCLSAGVKSLGLAIFISSISFLFP